MFHTIFFVPLYNALIFLTTLSGGSIAVGVIGLTILVKVILSPLAHKSIKSQIEQKKLQPLVDKLRKQYPDKKEQAQKLMELYKEHNTSPFAGIFLVLLQLPVIIALYQVFLAGAVVNGAELYSFVSVPASVQTLFLGIDMTARSIILALLAGISQFLQMYWSPAMQKTPMASDADMDPQAKMMASMQTSMKYTLPVMIGFFAYAVPGAVALYWVISNICMIIQERFVIRSIGMTTTSPRISE